MKIFSKRFIRFALIKKEKPLEKIKQSGFMRKITSLLSLLFLFMAGVCEMRAVSLTLDQILTADQIVAGKKIVLRGLKNNNPWINILSNNTMSPSKESVFVVEAAEGGFYLKHEVSGVYLKAYSGATEISTTTDKASAGVFEISNPTFNNEDDMNWLEPTKNHGLLTRFTSKGTNMKINTQGASAKAIYAIGTGGWSVMYVYDAENVDWDAEPEPESEYFEGDADKFYVISSINDANAFIAEKNDGSLGTATYSDNNKVFWKIIPTGQEGRFQVKNATSGRYIQSSKQTLSSRIPMGSNSVEYQIGKDMTAGAETKGYYYFCSTDQTNIPAGAIGLNYDKFASKNIVAWSAKSGDKNSYWMIRTVDYTYEPVIVPLVASMDEVNGATKYTLDTPDGQQLIVENGTLAVANESAEAKHAWVFVGTSNVKEGIYLVNSSDPTKVLTVAPDGTYSLAEVENGTRWFVAEKETEKGTRLTFVPYAQKDDENAAYLSVDGVSTFMLGNYRSAYSLAIQAYSLPCGTLDQGYLSRMKIHGEQVLRELDYTATAQPSNYYTLYTTEKATVGIGQEFDFTARVSNMDENITVYVYFDWNRDGVFEAMKSYNESLINDAIAVPEDAVVGKSRMRVRITNNGLADAEDDAIGSIYDFIINIAEPQAQRTVTVAPNDPERGSVELLVGEESVQSYTGDYGQEVTAVATPNQELDFIAWKDNRTVVSTDKEYNFTISENVDLVACFSPNSSFTTDIQGAQVNQNNFIYEIQQGDQEIQVVTDAEVKMVYVFAVDGTQVRKSAGKKVSVAGLGQGTYIVRVITSAGDASQKVALQ